MPRCCYWWLLIAIAADDIGEEPEWLFCFYDFDDDAMKVDGGENFFLFFHS